MKSKVSAFLRDFGFISTADRVRYALNKMWFYRKNRRFAQNHPEWKVPPDYIVYESYRLDYEAYIKDGHSSAMWIINELSAFTELKGVNILDWGCGPARIVRHLPGILEASNVIFGTDYNERTIRWCQQHVPGVNFSVNGIHPPLAYKDCFFHVVYSVSVFTHLSEENHTRWLHELYRVLTTNGILLFTTQGAAFKCKLSPKEKESFDRGCLIERTKVKEGHRLFSAFQPVSYMHSLFSDKWRVLKFTEGQVRDWGIEQDTWIIQKIS